MNVCQLASAKCQQAAAGLGEFKKLVYESKFTKYSEGTSFVNFEPSKKRCIKTARKTCVSGPLA